ncbi:hypothetical protein L3Y34_002535 [Caenorhabditis briggsae]|uniref:Uncharacterized protein n=1 Tax=Caenorhabditis briggsae TaxID=6238 RepID=A0AAE9DFN9_CAEBR|nr:hypothetical protein L3Y34_002535 [Caenorhabditis briggsae]
MRFDRRNKPPLVMQPPLVNRRVRRRRMPMPMPSWESLWRNPFKF